VRLCRGAQEALPYRPIGTILVIMPVTIATVVTCTRNENSFVFVR
jgi:hypothetical protein